MRLVVTPRSLIRCLCLLAALASTPLRQAEAAEDFAHSLGEIAHPYTIEDEDLYLAADSGSVMIRDGHHVDVGLADFAPVDLGAVLAEPVSGPTLARETLRDAVSESPPRRCARLQRFRF